MARYPNDSEYGGGDGTPTRYPDGSSLDVGNEGGSKGVQRAARVMRQAGIADFDPARDDLVGVALEYGGVRPSGDGISFAIQEAFDKDMILSKRRADERARLMAQTNNYVGEVDTYIGEAGEGNGVKGLGA